jgi:hypothetical protein
MKTQLKTKFWDRLLGIGIGVLGVLMVLWFKYLMLCQKTRRKGLDEILVMST